jgi:hypothetical protein
VNVGYDSDEDFNISQSNNSFMKFQPKLEEKRWNIAREKEIFQEWVKNKIYRFNVNAEKIFSIDTPPPYPRPA